MKYINILVLFTPEKNLCLDNIYYIISKINSLKKKTEKMQERYNKDLEEIKKSKIIPVAT